MKPIRLLIHLFEAVFIIALCLCALIAARPALALETIEDRPYFTLCFGCPNPPSGTLCAGPALCGFKFCPACFCVSDPIFGGSTCL